jgi:hypothetical protein
VLDEFEKPIFSAGRIDELVLGLPYGHNAHLRIGASVGKGGAASPVRIRAIGGQT